jgi:hypothetical protein
MKALVLLLGSGFLFGAMGCGDPCALPDGAALDYADDSHWLCKPGVEGPCTENLDGVEILLDGSVQAFDGAPLEAPEVDCFYLYPTMDLRAGAGLHTNVDDREGPQKATRSQATYFSEVCAVWAPLYRQMTFGTYFAREEVQETCRDSAFADVRAAFERFLTERGSGRPFVLYGHSQGAQHASRLLDEVVEEDDVLNDLLVAALPIGWRITTQRDERVGGSFDHTPLCSNSAESGCVIAYRSFAEGEEIPEIRAELPDDEVYACVNPADPAQSGGVTVDRAIFTAENPLITLPDGVEEADGNVLYGDLYQARCEREGVQAGLRIGLLASEGDVRQSPVDLEKGVASSTSGLHLIEVPMTLGSLLDAVHRMTTVFLDGR